MGQYKQIFTTMGVTGRMVVARTEAPAPIVTDEFAAVREEGRKAGLTEAQIERFIARQAA